MTWRVARSLDVLLDQINQRFPDRSKASDGSIGDAAHASRNSDHNPWYGPGIVTARDYTHDPTHGVDIGKLTDELVATRDPRIKYVIANGLILDSRPGNRPWQWVKYTGSNPHNHHFHLSVMDAPMCDEMRPWRLASFSALPAPASSVLKSGSKGRAVNALQAELNRQYPAYSHLVVDGDFGRRPTRSSGSSSAEPV